MMHAFRTILAAVVCSCLLASSALAQIFREPTELIGAELQLIDSAGAAHLENARQLLEQKQYDEAVEAIRRVLENDNGRLIRVNRGKANPESLTWHVTVREYCHWRLASLAREAPEALAVYRRLVDPLAERWLNEGRQQHQPALLRRVIDEAWASRWGDDAALALGDEALSRGDLAVARYWWDRINLGFKPVALQPGEVGPYYPDSDLQPADVQARLILVAILSGDHTRAEEQLTLFRKAHGAAEGTIAGRRGNYVELLTALREQAKSWPTEIQSAAQHTWGGTAERNGIFVAPPDPAGKPLWTAALPRLTSDRDVISAGRLRIADDMKSLTTYHPVVWKNDVLVRADSRGDSYLAAFDLLTGAMRWRVGYPRAATRQNEPPADDGTLGEINEVHSDSPRHVGVARYTLTVAGDKAFVRMGSPVTAPRSRRIERLLAKDQGWLLGVDLAAEGKPLSGFPIRPESTDWSFEGAPLVHDGALYVAMRHVEGSRSQIYVACFEIATTFLPSNDEDENSRPSGRLRFRTRIASAPTLGGGNLDEVSGLLLTIAHGHVYCNTNAGAIGAVEAATGKLKWVVTYPRSLYRGDESASDATFVRDLNPCLAAGDQLIVAPQDCDRLFALDALSGEVRWQTPAGTAADATALLGVRNNTLIAAGDRIYWIDAQRGSVLAQYPAGKPDASSAAASPRGLGQGTIVGDQVWWPTRESVLIFGLQPVRNGASFTPPIIKELPLVPRGLTGGNLVVAGDKLLITTGTKLAVFGPQPPPSSPTQPEAR